jgi:hypothetical protein|tara:strand:- start:87 stop:485 length:399 start_codon:yes stop_codon:yes gene_type:complete
MNYLKLLLSLLFIGNIKAFICNSNRYPKNVILHSHTNKIRTEFEDKNLLIKSLLDVNPYLVIYENYKSDITIRQKNGMDIVFTFKDNYYQMKTDLKYWELSTPPDIFLKLLTQKYSINGILDDLDREGFYVN